MLPSAACFPSEKYKLFFLDLEENSSFDFFCHQKTVKYKIG